MGDADKTPAQGATVQGKDSPCAVQERARIRGMVQWLLVQSLPAHQAWPDEPFNLGVQAALRHVVAILDSKDPSHE
jgi:hypothetical protein